jgi:hypothetical protein
MSDPGISRYPGARCGSGADIPGCPEQCPADICSGNLDVRCYPESGYELVSAELSIFYACIYSGSAIVEASAIFAARLISAIA